MGWRSRPPGSRGCEQKGVRVEDAVPNVLDLPAVQKELELQRRALCTLLALVTGKPVMTDELEGLLKELGFVPVSPLLMPATARG